MTSAKNETWAAQADLLDQIVKAYDIRGVVPTQWNETSAQALGAATAEVLAGDAGHLLVGHDMRDTSTGLVAAFAAGAALRGVAVTSIGLCSTDGLYYASGALGLPGAMFTASHNPAQYNGIKLCRAGALAVGQETGLAQIHKLAAEYLRQGRIPAAEETGQIATRDVLGQYAEYLRGLVDLSGSRPLKVVVDAGNGMGGLTVPAVLGTAAGLPELPLDIVPMYFELDGTFPNHEANPLEPANLVDLQAEVVRQSADLGLAFDGDADRCFAVDEKGAPISPSAVTALVALRELAKEQAAGSDGTILVNAITSSAVAEQVTAAGGEVVRTKVGHSHIKATMAQTGAVFGGEHSAHYYFRDFWGADTGMLAALHLLAAVAEQSLPVSEMMAEFSPYHASGEINSTVADASVATAAVVAAVGGPDDTVDTLDGTTVVAQDGTWWCNVRPSNTEPLLRLNVEAHDPQVMATVRDKALAAIADAS